MAYTPNPTWVDGSGGGTPITAATLNHLENGVVATAVVADAAIAKPGAPASNDGLVWNGSTWTNAKLVNANVDPAAAIAYSKLNLAGLIVNNDISNAAALDPAKLGGGGTRAASTFLRGDNLWANLAPYRKTTSKTVNTTVSATDLLNGEITIAAAVMGATGALRFSAWGDWLQNSGGAAAAPRWQLVFGGATLLDTTAGPSAAASVTRGQWSLTVEILNTAAAVQVVRIRGDVGSFGGFSAGSAGFTTGTGTYQNIYTGSGTVTAIFSGVGTGTVNTVNAQTLVLNVINGSANAAYETKLFGALVEVI